MRARVVDAAGGVLADFAAKRSAAATLETHAGEIRGDQRFRDTLKLGIILGRKARPVRRIGAAGAAALAVEDGERLDILARRQNGRVS